MFHDRADEVIPVPFNDFINVILNDGPIPKAPLYTRYRYFDALRYEPNDISQAESIFQNWDRTKTDAANLNLRGYLTYDMHHIPAKLNKYGDPTYRIGLH